jgi:hypothetical protein
LLLDEGIWLSFFSRNGVYKGRLQPPIERGGKLRLRLWERSRDHEFCLQFGRAVVRGKILGEKLLASAYAKNYLAETLGDGFVVLRDSLVRLDKVQEITELRGVEGAAARSYFEMFRRWNRSGMPFDGRVKRGAGDPINALLNLGYTLLTRELEGLIEAAGLDPTIGTKLLDSPPIHGLESSGQAGFAALGLLFGVALIGICIVILSATLCVGRLTVGSDKPAKSGLMRFTKNVSIIHQSIVDNVRGALVERFPLVVCDLIGRTYRHSAIDTLKEHSGACGEGGSCRYAIRKGWMLSIEENLSRRNAVKMKGRSLSNIWGFRRS